MISSETNDQLTIVNRSKEHLISKKLICKIPYFEMMLSNDYLESKENKVELDFDDEALKSFLCWVEYGRLHVGMNNAINLYILTDYFGMDNLMQKCTEYFHTRFSIEHLPTVIPQVTENSMLINSSILNSFICRHFLKIANTTVWLGYPVETIEYICGLDLMVSSELQVFDAISRWIDFEVDTRKCHLERLLNFVRWYRLEDKDLCNMKLVESSCLKLESDSSSKRSCSFNRAKQNCFIVLEESDSKDLRIIVLDKNYNFLFNRDLKTDESISSNLLHDEHISDIFYHSGRRAIRIDWHQNKYRGFSSYKFKFYFRQLCRLVANPKITYINSPGYGSTYRYDISNTAGSRLIHTHGHDEEFEYWLTKLMQTGAKFTKNSELLDWVLRLRVTVVSNNIFILTNNLEFGQFDVRHKHFKKIGLPKLEAKQQYKYESLFITSSVDHADRVFLINESTEKVFCFNLNIQKWSLIGGLLAEPSNSKRCGYIRRESKELEDLGLILIRRFFNTRSSKKRRSADSESDDSSLLTVIPAFLPLDIISTCSNHNLNSVH